MKRKLLILFLTCVVGWLSPLNAQTIDLTTQYRVKVYSGNSTGMYLHINTTNEPTRATQVGVANQQESNNQIFTVEEVGDGNYYLKTADGYYIRCNNNDYTNYNDNDTYNNGLGNWGVAAYSTTDKSPLTFEYSGDVFYIRDANKTTSNNNYFKIQSSLVYCDAASGLDDPDGDGYVCTWILKEYVAPTLSAVNLSAEKSLIYTDETVSITATTTGGTTPFTYNWSATSGSIDGNGQTVTFIPSSVGTSDISCSVTDAKGVTVVSNTVTITVDDAANRPQNCNIEIVLKDSANDGWNSATLTVAYGSTSTDLGLNNGSEGTNLLEIPTGTEVTVTYNKNSNSWAYENSYVIRYKDGDEIYASDGTPSNGQKTTFTTDCAEEAFQLSLSASNTSVCETDAVELTATVDGDGTYYYTWTVTEGSGEFSNATAATTNFTPSSTGNCVIKCSVYDGTTTVEKTISLTVYDVPELTVSQNTFDIEANGTATIELTYSGDNQPNISNYEIIDEIDSSVANKLVITTTPLKETTELTFKLYNFDSPYGEYDGVWGYLCAAEETVTINVEEALFVEIGTENDVTSICEDDANGIQLVATPKFAAGDVTYSWTSETEGALEMLSATNIANPVFTPSSIDAVSSTVTYTCTVGDGETTSSDEITLTVYDTPEFEDIPSLISAAAGDKVTISVKFSNCGLDYTYYYDSEGNFNPTYVTTDDGAELTYTVEESMNIALSLSSWYNSSCSSTANVRIEVPNENKEVEIGTNEDLNSRKYLPVYAEKNYSITQQIYTAEELDITESSQINSISFYTTWCNENARNIDVYLVETDKEAFSTTTDFVNMLGTATPNYSGDVTFVNEGWTTISFTESFTYEPGTNILVCVNDKTGSTDGSAFEFGHYSTTEARSIVRYSSSDTPYDATNIDIDYGYTTDNFLNQNNHIKLGYEAIANSELVANISVDNTSLCDGTNGNVFNLLAERVENATYAWYYGDSELPFSEVRETSYSNANPGTYTIKLVVTQNGVSKESTIDLTINPEPNADLVMGTNGYGFVGEEIGFTKEGEHIDGTTYAIDLNVDDVHSNYYNVELDTHKFDVDGTFSYTVEASIGECETTLTKGVTIYPAASFEAGDNYYACAGQEVEFTNTTKTPNIGEWNFVEGEGEGFVWNFGDGTETLASNEETVTHTYEADGTYNVTLTVTKSGISNVYEHQVIVSELPTAEFTYEGEYALTDITFTATDAGNQATYTWNFGDETEGTGKTCTHQYATPGEYTVTLTVSQNGCSSTKEETIEVAEKVSGAAIEPAFVELGDRPNNGWMRPYTINITPDGNTSLTISTLTVEDNYSDEETLIVLNHAELPVTLDPGEMFPVEVSTKIIGEGIGDGSYYFDILVNESDPTNKTDEHIGAVLIYTAYTTDIVEVALEIDASTEETYTPLDEAGDLYPNYLLPGVDTENEYYDAVFKFTFEEATQLTATVNGTNPVAYVYPENFGGEPGPGLTNYVGVDEINIIQFVGFNYTFKENTGINLIDADNGGDNFVVDIYADPYYIRSAVSRSPDSEDNYLWTSDKYYVSENAVLSYDVLADQTENAQYYEILLSENSDYSNPVVVKSETRAVADEFATETINLTEYKGKEYYFGIRHKSDVRGRIKFDNFKLYEPETRALRANAEPTLNIMLEAGTYYLVAAAANNDFTVTIGSETLSEPGQATDPRPRDYSTNVAETLEQLTWTFGEFTEEYQVLFGTTNPPTDVLVDWNNNIENASCALSTTLMTNTVYYWQVNARNILGTTEGAVWRFATPFDAPQNLALNPLEIEENETSVFTWNAIDNASLTGYNIYIDNVKNNTELVTSATYTISGLSYKVDPYIVQVEAVYNVDGFEIKSKSYKIELKVNAEASVKGFVYDATTGEPIVGATVTYATTELTTDANGYTGKVPAGNYRAVARMAGYNKSEVTVELVPSEETYTYDFTLEPTMTLATGVIATERDDKTAVDVEWQFNLEGDPMIENFENGFTYEWTTSADYPWEVVANGYEEGSAGYELYGGYCVKSTNSDYDYDQLTGGNREDNDYPLQNTTTYLELTTFIPFDGKISFYYRIDSDPYGDYGKFYIDDVQQGYNLMGENSQWLTDSKLEFDVTAGTHTFKWAYSKNDGWYYGTDAFYVDNITFYENTNLYNVYRRDILTAEDPTNLAENLTVKELADTEWANENFADGIYQWGVSVEYNEPASDLLNEDFEGVEEPESFLTGWTKYTEELGSYELLNQWHVNVTGEYGISACGGTGYSAFVSPLPGESVFYFVTPKVNASRQATLEFDYIIPCFREEDFPNDFSKFKVAYSTSPTGPWTDLTSFNKTSVEDWTHATVELPLEEELYIAFIDQNVENWGKGIGLDNVRIHREAVIGESEIAWSNLIGKGNELVTDGDWNVEDNWSRTHVPTVDEVAIIKAAGTVNNVDAVDAVAKAVLVDNGTLTIGENGVLTASTVIDSVATDITINAGGQLVHSNEGVMAIFIKGINAYTDAAKNDGWYTISSPLAADINASQVSGLLEGEFDLYRYDEPTHYWENYEDNVDAEGPNNTDWDNNSAVIEKGRGYLYANGADKQLSFEGELNVAEVTTTLSAQALSLTGFNLLGNPFAHNIYKGVAFSGSIADAHYTLNYHGEWKVVTSENPIKSGAGFLVQATEGANLTISKTNAQTRAAANSMLAVTVVNNVFEDVAYVSFNDGIGLEKIGHMNEYAPMVYIPGDFNNYAYATVEEDVTEVPVNFEAMTMGEYTIAVKAKNCEYETMILVDNLTGKETNLLKDSYTFMATTTDDPDRFVIKLAKDAEVEDSFIYINNGELIFDNLSNDAIINVFDVLGRNVATFNNCGDTTFRVSTDLFADGVYMVRVIEGNNVKVQKMVIE